MSVFNRRNAVTGWLTWMVAKRILKRKASQAVPGTVEGSNRPNKSLIALALGAAVGVLWLWRRTSSGDELPPPTGE
jgi:hypothetical protein